MDFQLLNYLRSVSELSDADALAAVNTPIYTPRTSRVTFATLCSADVWGMNKASTFRAAIKAANNALSDSVLALIDAGFDATDPQATAQAAGMVALANGAITADDAKLALNTVSYPTGSIRTLDDITAARAALTDELARGKIISALANVLNEWLPLEPTAPSKAAVLAKVQAELEQAGAE